MEEYEGYIYVLDYNVGDLYEIPLTKKDCEDLQDSENYDEILVRYDFNEDECSYMVTNQKLEINTLKHKNG